MYSRCRSPLLLDLVIHILPFPSFFCIPAGKLMLLGRSIYNSAYPPTGTHDVLNQWVPIVA